MRIFSGVKIHPITGSLTVRRQADTICVHAMSTGARLKNESRRNLVMTVLHRGLRHGIIAKHMGVV
jgi:hypothetical protein